MTRLFAAAALCALALGLSCGAVAKDVHVISPGVIQNGSVSTAAMDARMEEAAGRGETARGTVSRAVFFDAALPRDAEEYVAVAGYSIVLFMAVAQDPAALPLRRAFLRAGGRDLPLKPIYQFARDTGAATAARQAFGRARTFTYYLVPTAALMAEHELDCDFARGEGGFVVDRQVAGAPDYLTPAVASAAAHARPSLAALRAFLTREYPGTDLAVTQKDLR